MHLQLAIAKTCTPTGCDALLEDNTILSARYSSLVQDRILIRPGQLLALNFSVHPPEIVWRWVRAAVHELRADTVILDDGRAALVEVVRVPALDVPVAVGDEVWTSRTGGPPELHDLVIGGRPANPARLLAYIGPLIESIYFHSPGLKPSPGGESL